MGLADSDAEDGGGSGGASDSSQSDDGGGDEYAFPSSLLSHLPTASSVVDPL